ncbi:hypothetical protein MTAT_01050 [Moorella thermoacetica]|uniref:Uncharacterized protein n=1 Tax=Neomoorella thermoacetica TaxID=1525 RepID=A0AAC9MW39_NEOTH|nr:hypothetical protein Maut_02681 [Moorella thermoacetica]TYL15372.1 hypothetical protein MTAT_01050 [Moorella thermoacetica]
MEAYLRDVALPFFRQRGFQVSLGVTKYGLGPRQFWLVTQMDNFDSIDQWEGRTGGTPGAKK